MLKTLHLLGACLFIGNIIVSAFWKALADRSEQPDVMRFALRLVGMTNLLFTGTGVALLLSTGYFLEKAGGGTPHLGSGVLGYLLPGISILIWIAVLMPIQARQSRMLASMSCFSLVPRRYHELNRIWSAAGLMAIIISLPALYLMIPPG